MEHNWAIHQHPDVVTALAKWPRLVPLWLPTYAPWLNPTLEALALVASGRARSSHQLAGDWPALHQRVRAFLHQFATESHDLLRYAGLLGEASLAQALCVA